MRKLLLGLTAVLLLSEMLTLSPGSEAKAATTFYYDSPNYMSQSGGLYDTSMNLSGWITFDQEINPELSIFDISTATDWAFWDGVHAFTPADIASSPPSFGNLYWYGDEMILATINLYLEGTASQDGLGGIQPYFFIEQNDYYEFGMVTAGRIEVTFSEGQSPSTVDRRAATETYSTLDWSLTSAVPVPGAIWLFGSGLVGLVGLGRRKNKA